MKVGFFGKLPSYGDFVQRNVSPIIVDNWDNWLMKSLQDSQYRLKDKWKEVFFNSPIWRFTIDSKSVHDNVVSGIIMPSVDSAGRCYPFTSFCQCERDVNIFSLSNNIDDLHLQTEEFMLNILQKKRPDLDEIQAVLEDMYKKLDEWKNEELTPSDTTCSNELYRFSGAKMPNLSLTYENLLTDLLKQHSCGLSIFSTLDTDNVEGQRRFYAGLPPSDTFASLLLGQ